MGEAQTLTPEIRNAIVIAETFIKENGYTNYRVNKSETVLEITEYMDTSITDIFNRRFNSLHPKAFCISEKDTWWDIGFLSTDVDIRKSSLKEKDSDLPGRAVRVEKSDLSAIMVHEDPLFSKFRRL
jgi:hypothetical protein